MKLSPHKSLLLLHDIIIIIVGILISHYLYFSYRFLNSTNFTVGYLWGYLILFFAILIFFPWNHLYEYQIVLNHPRHTAALLKSLFASFVVLIFISFIFKLTEITMGRVLLGITFAVLLALLFISRVIIVPQIYYWLVRTKRIHRNLLIIGAGKESIERAKHLKENKGCYFNICGFLDDDEAKQGKSFEDIPVLGKFKDLREVVNTYKIKEILISINNISYEKFQSLVDLCKETQRPIYVVSELYNIIPEKLEVEEIAGISAFRLQSSAQKSGYETIKRFLDVVISSVIIIITFPVWIIVALLIKITSSGPVFYKARAIGKNGKEFLMFKFRSMYSNCSEEPHKKLVQKVIYENRNTKKLRRDERITPLGKFLRKFSIDEFPQLWNVLKGEMSLVGPRPCLPYEYKLMDNWHRKRASVTSGMTGIWQIRGRDEVKFNNQVILDLYYLENRSLRLDLEILLKTIPIVLFGRGGM